MTTRYNIEKLLAGGEQPWGPLPQDTFDAIEAGILDNKGKLIVPVIVSARGRLLDGHHRLLIAQHAGRKTIGADEVRIDKTAKDVESEVLAAIGYQRNRRHTTVEDNAKVARDLIRRFKWSQGQVAEKLRVSAAAVSQWLKAFPDPTFEVTERTGRDGKTYTVEADAEDDGEAATEAPKPRKRSMKGPDALVANQRAVIVNDDFKQWVMSWAMTTDQATRERVAVDLSEIAETASGMAESLRAFKDDEPEVSF